MSIAAFTLTVLGVMAVLVVIAVLMKHRRHRRIKELEAELAQRDRELERYKRPASFRVGNGDAG